MYKNQVINLFKVFHLKLKFFFDGIKEFAPDYNPNYEFGMRKLAV